MKPQSFTRKYEDIVNTLETSIGVANPITTRYSGSPPHPTHNFNAIWDTGAQHSLITLNVANALGLKPIDVVKVSGAYSSGTANVYVLDFYLPNRVFVKDVKVTEGILQNDDILIGMDIIGIGDFAVSNFNKKTTFTFRFPSVKETDYVAEGKEPIKSTKVIGRNSLCPCGSGLKYKFCCGK